MKYATLVVDNLTNRCFPYEPRGLLNQSFYAKPEATVQEASDACGLPVQQLNQQTGKPAGD